MYEPQHYTDLQDNNAASGFGTEANSWLAAGQDHSSPILRRSQCSFSTASGTNSGNLDRNLFNDLVEMVPLVQSLIDRKAKTTFTRRGSMIYTKTPARESLSKPNEKGRHAAQSIPRKKYKDRGDKDQTEHAGNNQDGNGSDFSFFPLSTAPTEKEIEELIAMRDQVEDLRRKLSEKDELLKSTEISKNQMASSLAKLDELKHQVLEKDSLVKSTQVQLSDAKIKLANKQAALEKLQWEAMNSNTQAGKLQEEVHTMQAEMSAFTILCEGLRNNNEETLPAEDYDVTMYHSGHVSDTDFVDEMEMQKMEEAREVYIAAVGAAKENQDDESIAAARSARLHLQSFVFKN